MTLMDEVQRRRFLDTLRQDAEFRAEVRRELLTEELLALPQSVALLVASINGLIDHQAEMQRELAAMQRELAEMRGDVGSLVATTGQLLRVTQDGFTEFRQGFAAVDARFERIEGEIRDIKDRLAS